MPFHGATTIGVATTGLNTFLKCGPRAVSKAWAARSQRTVAAVAAKGNTMYSKLALAATTIGFLKPISSYAPLVPRNVL